MSRYRRLKDFHNTLNSKHAGPSQTISLDESEISIQITTLIFFYSFFFTTQ